jgi:Bacterial lipoate protein ligase C-terminus.
LLVENGRISAITFFGDFFGPRDVHELADSLTDVVYDRGHITSALDQIDVSNYFTGISRDELIDLLA